MAPIPMGRGPYTVLLTNCLLREYAGTQAYLADVALALRDLGHRAIVYSPVLGAAADSLASAGVEVTNDLGSVKVRPNVIHGQHHLETMAALHCFPDTPGVYFCHGRTPWVESPPLFPRLLRYVSVGEATTARLMNEAGLKRWQIVEIPNFIDMGRFQPRRRLPARPSRALVFSNQATVDNYAKVIIDTCRTAGIEVEIIGHANGNPEPFPEQRLPDFDLVFARGRCAIEAMATGAAVILADIEGFGELVTTNTLHALRARNFGAAALARETTPQNVLGEIERYDPTDAARVSRSIRRLASRDNAVEDILRVYEAVIAEWAERRQDTPPEPESAGTARYLCWLRQTMPVFVDEHRQALALLQAQQETLHHANVALEAAQAKARDCSDQLRTVMSSPLVRYVAHPLWKLRARVRPPRSPGPRKDGRQDAVPGIAIPADEPLLACVVIDFRGATEVADAVRSLVAQDVPIEIVVVNSGGGDVEGLLAREGLEAKVVEVEEPMFAGGARNLGIGHTRAPFVAFLASDCRARPGWARGRIVRHLAGAAVVASAITQGPDEPAASWASHILLHAGHRPGVPGRIHLRYGASYARSVLIRHGLFRDDLRVGEDTEYKTRLDGFHEIAWGPEVVITHRNPVSVSQLLADQYRRGRRTVHAWAALDAPIPRRTAAFRMLRRLVPQARLFWRSATGSERWKALPALPLLLPGTLAGMLGAATAPVTRPMTSTRRVHTWATDAGPTRRPRLVALLAYHDEKDHLSDYFSCLSGLVDGVIALDDGSTDGSEEIVKAQPLLLELLHRQPRKHHTWNEPLNKRLLVHAARHHGAEWVIVLDADERLECSFRTRAEALISQAEQDGTMAFSLRMCELWDSPDQYRVDGIWGRKTVARLFRLRADHQFDDRTLHGQWAPLNSLDAHQCKSADINIYHLRMIRAQDRLERKRRYQKLDPEKRWQEMGYAYMTDTTNLALQPIEEHRHYRPEHHSVACAARPGGSEPENPGTSGVSLTGSTGV